MRSHLRRTLVSLVVIAAVLGLIGCCVRAVRALATLMAQAVEFGNTLSEEVLGSTQSAPLQVMEPDRPELALSAARATTAMATGGSRNPSSNQAAALGTRACATRDARMVASVVNTVRPDHSFAAIRVQGATRIITLGAQANGLQLLALSPTYARIRIGDSEPCTLPVFLPPGERQMPDANTLELDLRTSARIARPQSLQSYVRHAGGSQYFVSKALLPYVLANPRLAGRGSRLRKLEKHGQLLGYEVARLRKRSLLSSLGLQEGDVLRSINGRPLLGVEELLEGVHQLHQGRPITLSVMRNNIPQNMRYSPE